MRNPSIAVSALLISLMVMLVASCASIDKGMMSVSNAISSPDPVTGRREINLEPEDREIARAEQQASEIVSQAKSSGAKVDEQTSHYNRVVEVFNKLTKVAHRNHLPWEVHVIEDKAWNAFTIGGGKVFVCTGLLEGDLGVKTDDELAAVLAHEIAHVTARHPSEERSKTAIAQLVHKELRTDSFEASFTTNQEDEADRFSVIYSALSGYDPTAAVNIWKRMQEATGSYTSNLLYDHPLNDDRARNLQNYSNLARQYYKPGAINPNHEALLANNAVFYYRKNTGPKVGEGGGIVALLETAANAYTEVLKAKAEQQKRQLKQFEQEKVAAQQLIFQQLKIANTRGGGRGLFGYAINATGKAIKEAIVNVRYWAGQQVVYEEKMPWPEMKPHEQRQFGIPLKAIQYTGVTISSKYVHLSE
jgi:predicted Zn-dependent protease